MHLKFKIFLMLAALIILTGCLPKPGPGEPESAPGPSTPVNLPEASDVPEASSALSLPINSISPSSETSDESEPPPITSSSDYIEPSTDSVIIILEETTLELAGIEADPGAFRVSARLQNNSSMAIALSYDYCVERYTGEAWASFPFSSQVRPNWLTGGGDTHPGEEMELSFWFWYFEQELSRGRYRFVYTVGPGFATDRSLISFNIYAEFEIV